MKFNQALLALLATTASVAVATPTHSRLDYDSLSSSSSPDLLIEALSQNGLVSITNLPNNFHETKRPSSHTSTPAWWTWKASTTAPPPSP
mmetsp:Transcript_27073/g.55266  ORF Transcript_27073/g.55266 Transcript_27073/m.55266 type:complete len:90 (+) Transcript_27073:92-361(+)